LTFYLREIQIHTFLLLIKQNITQVAIAFHNVSFQIYLNLCKVKVEKKVQKPQQQKNNNDPVINIT